MQTIEAKVEVKDDRVMSVQLPTNLPIGEYDVVLVLSQRSDLAVVEGSGDIEGEQPDHLMTEAWAQWVAELETLPLSSNSIQAGDYQQHLVEKYRKQGLEL
jgi:hypothetical protein